MDPDIKKKALQLFPSALFVVGCGKEENVHAFGGSWFGQCSFDPPVVWIGVKNESRPIALLDSCGVFTLSVLSAEQKDTIGTFFKTPPPEGGKFGDVPYNLSPLGAPVLEDCLAWVECKVCEKITPGDHTLYYGEVVDCAFNEEAPVLTTVTTGWKYGG